MPCGRFGGGGGGGGGGGQVPLLPPPPPLGPALSVVPRRPFKVMG